jgi:hypothetical protein
VLSLLLLPLLLLMAVVRDEQERGGAGAGGHGLYGQRGLQIHGQVHSLLRRWQWNARCAWYACRYAPQQSIRWAIAGRNIDRLGELTQQVRRGGMHG